MSIQTILAIESSCDDTSLAIMNRSQGLVKCLSRSQAGLHRDFGGVVPEIAARGHLDAIFPLLEELFSETGYRLWDMDAFAATAGPGLVGSLLVGLNLGKTLAMMCEKPFLGIHHMEAHLAAARLEGEIHYPSVGLLVSGGHSSLYLLPQPAEYRLLGETRDDAIGEVYDKVGRELGMGANAGPLMDKLAKTSQSPVPFKPPMLHSKDYDFSFSGLKTACLNALKDGENPEDVAAGLQHSAVEVLVKKTLKAAREFSCLGVVAAGGVAANSHLRSELERGCRKSGLKLSIPPIRWCTDNAAMVAQAAMERFALGQTSRLDLAAFSRMSLNELACPQKPVFII